MELVGLADVPASLVGAQRAVRFAEIPKGVFGGLNQPLVLGLRRVGRAKLLTQLENAALAKIQKTVVVNRVQRVAKQTQIRQRHCRKVGAAGE